MDLLSLVRRLMDDGTLAALANNPLAAYPNRARTYLGATLLPERTVEENAYRESQIRYRTVIANDGTRYSPAQLKDDGQIAGEMAVELGHNDIARQFTARDYDAFIRLLARNATEEAILRLINWTDVTVVRALLDLNEKQRWQAIRDAQVIRQGDNNYREVVAYPNPAGHRVTAAGTWSSDAYDPLDDIAAAVDLLASKGYAVNRLIGSRKVASILAGNAKMQQRATNMVFVDTAGQVRGLPPRILSSPKLNAILAAEGLPILEQYDELYRDYDGPHRFLADDTLVFAATTGESADVAADNLELSDILPPFEDVLGYTAVGRPAGEATPGRVIRMFPQGNKPPRIDAEGWQVSLPVITEPEALVVIKGIG